MTNPHPLALQCESATADEQREMLEQAFYAIFPAPECGTDARHAWVALSHRFHAMLSVEAWESAALMLVPEDAGAAGEFYRVEAYSDAGVLAPHVRASAWVVGAPRAYAATPALALTAASLRAHAALANEKESDDERVA